MRNSLFLLLVVLNSCATKTVCINSNESFQAVLDPGKNCAVRIREVVIGSDLELPKSISFKDSDAPWGYRWIESSYKAGALELGHFVLVPQGRDLN